MPVDNKTLRLCRKPDLIRTQRRSTGKVILTLGSFFVVMLVNVIHMPSESLSRFIADNKIVIKIHNTPDYIQVITDCGSKPVYEDLIDILYKHIHRRDKPDSTG